MQLLLATNNPGKKEELLLLIKDLDIEVLLPSEIAKVHVIFPEETGETFSENAFLKASSVFQQILIPTLADDSGLSIPVLNGFPGVFSARWLAGSDQDRVNGLLQKLDGSPNRAAYFTCVLCFIESAESTPKYFDGILKGSIALEHRGTQGFGYDSIFIPEGSDKTLAELDLKTKNKISHRAVASQKLIVYLQKKYAKLGATHDTKQ